MPTTTLSAQTSNNTSAANSFPTQSNGNLGAGNVSKVNVHSLLYAGATTKVYAHLLLWFGESSHMNVGYNSNNAAQVHSQVEDMISRGIDGVIIDWYGPNNSIDQATQLVMAEAEKHPGFTFAIMVDQGAIEWDSCSGCTPQQALISQLQYIEQTYFPSPAYMTIGGQPMVTNFNVALAYSIDWNAVNAALSTHPAFLFQNNSGFTQTLSDGSYSWVMPTTTDYGMSYLTSFYDTGEAYPGEETVGAGYKGFNDTLASWGSDRIMQQQCGQTWLQTFANANSIYNSGKQLPYFQLVTWNDYEEGTEIESGIDNCVSVSGSVSGNELQWQLAGSESAIDHFTVYISTDGENLMSLAQLDPGIDSLNLCTFGIPSGNYKLFVQAVGRPSLANRITAAINYAPSCASASGGPSSLGFSASPATQTIQAGQSGSFTVTAVAQSGAFDSPIALGCSNLPSVLTCSFSPAAITPGSGSAVSTLTISAVTVVGAKGQHGKIQGLFYAAWLCPFGIAGLAFVSSGERRKIARTLVILGVAGIGLASSSCGGSAARPGTGAASVASSYAVTVTGTAAGSSGSTQVSSIVTVTVP
ncbi:MAG TPA: hypothetical protein VMD99_13290 [Terriglobales bacterium]|nr:hypothetical protein [Terriglobales bacterium]